MSIATLYAAHLPYVRGAVRQLGVAEADVDDVTQEVFLVLMRRPPAEPASRGMRRWLYQTARRVASNHRRGRRRREQRLAHAWGLPSSLAACPERAAMDRQARERLDRELEALPAASRALYRLSEVEALPGPEVAQRLGLNPNTAYARVRALRRRLAQALLVLALLLAALLVSQAGCTVSEASSSVVARARGASEATEVGGERGGLALRGPALGLAALAGPG
ncbi:MAG: sigma-70 family RNA polymerase sigma factor [Myxococcales bacterium]|nr:sigma-70 family RNA polymerase sigma factor [Myxococcales bacterium]